MYRSLILLVIGLGLTAALPAQLNNQVQFGKNRVQYHDDFEEWLKYESDNFITYWYGKSRNVGQAVVQMAEYDFQDIQSVLEHRINEKVQIIVYADLTDLKQTNIGSEETFTNIGGQTKIVGNKMFVYFNGDHNHLRRQVREGIANIYLEAMLFGSNIQEIVQNAVLLNLPTWFKEGLVSYVGRRWSVEEDDRLRDLMLSEDYEGFEKLAEKEPILAGHALWYYISQQYGQSTVSNLLYLTRINRSVESGFLYVLGNTFEMVQSDMEGFYLQRYTQEARRRDASQEGKLAFKNKHDLPVTEAKISPDGRYLAYVLNEIGKYKIYLHDLTTGDREVLMKEGFRNAFQATDYSYPLLAWNPNNQMLAILYEKRDKAYLRIHNIRTDDYEEEPLSPQYQRVFSIDYVDPFRLVFSAMVEGFSDIYLYFTKTRQSQQITRDFYDDLDATYVEIRGRKGILFASNRLDTLLRPMRMDTILPIGTYDIFYYNLEEQSQELVRVTNTPYANERRPIAIDTTWFGYSSNQSGIFNRETGYLEEYVHHYDRIILLNSGDEIRLHVDSTLESLDTSLIDSSYVVPVIKERAVTHINSNFDRNLRSHHTASRLNKTVTHFIRNGSHELFIRELRPDSTYNLYPTTFRRSINQITEKAEDPGASGKEPASQPTPEKTEKRDNNLNPLLPPLPEREPIPTEAAPVPAEADTVPDINEGYLFQTEFGDPEPKAPTDTTERTEELAGPELEPEEISILPPMNNALNLPTQTEEQRDVHRFRPGRITSYRVKFRTDYVTTKLDNNLLFQGLETFAANPEEFQYPPPGILLKANFKDLFEDHEVEGGVRVPTTFNGTEFFLIYRNKKTRFDKEFAVYRRNQRFNDGSPTFVPRRRELDIVLGQFTLRYPLDIFRSLRATTTLRRDRITQLASDDVTLNVPTQSDQRVGLRLEYVFDNTLDVSLNIKNGTRYKIYAEALKRFDIDLADGVSLSFDEGFMTLLGVDFRHYQRLLKRSVIATRFSAGTSFGSERILYLMGGVDNWLFPSRNNDIPIASDQNYAFQTLSTNLRGFDTNIRNGSSFALVNTELRIPVFQYISKNIKSPLLRNFQAVGFFDVGTAWTGTSPFDDDNPLNTTEFINSDQISIEVQYFRDPIVAGYGVGARTTLFGYFIRVDYGWGIETRVVQDPKWFIALGTDF